MGCKGRRTDVNTNAFWSAAAALLPRDLLVNRKGRAEMRGLGLNYRAIKRAGEIRARMEDEHGGCQLLTTSEHCDRVDWNQVQRWFHSDGASTEGSGNKRMARVVGGEEPETARVVCEKQQCKG